MDVEIVGADHPARFVIDAHEHGLRLLSADQGQVLGHFRYSHGPVGERTLRG